MATIDEEWRRLKFLAENGRANEKVHVAFVEVEAQERIKNAGPKPKTQFRMETDSPEVYSRLNALKDRWFDIANKSVALSVMIRLWDMPEDWIRRVCDQEDIQTETLGDA
jgi:hypothetical protein